ncbi:MAG: hypothetical protein NMNS01_02160 [Nitrosomonas sp.]|nr:MAG: hypothetical protein NMNS01_02160 [Nitrosomonas sp.]
MIIKRDKWLKIKCAIKKLKLASVETVISNGCELFDDYRKNDIDHADQQGLHINRTACHVECGKYSAEYGGAELSRIYPGQSPVNAK